MKRIEILIGPAGETRIEAFGFEGKGCVDATAFLEKALGVSEQRTRKPEHFRFRRVANQQRLGQSWK